MYRKLNAEKVIETLEILTRRIKERFPESGLAKISIEMTNIGKEAHERSLMVGRPNIILRIAIGLIITVIIAAFVLALPSVKVESTNMGIVEFVHVLESGINDIVLIGAAILFLATVENRVKRSRMVDLMNELRVFCACN
ncbi:MAG TPA: hypothetical protein DDX37_01865 [Candidatus Omnitrophica bacterium]|nr:hypothetical protein [Candidatus Omnitrophota bacterium]